MPKQSEYKEFRTNFMQMICRFNALAPTLVRSGGASSAIALRTGRVASLLDQSLPDDDGGALTAQDHAVLGMAMARAGELMDVLDPMAVTTEIRPFRFDDQVFAARLRSVDPADYADLVQAFSLMPGGRGKKETLDIICKLIEGFDEVFKGSIFEIIKKILMIILQVLAGRTVLPQKIIDLIPTIFKIIDDLIDGGDEPVPPGEGGGDPVPAKRVNAILKPGDGETLELIVPAGKQAVASFVDLVGPNADRRRSIVRVSLGGQATPPISLGFSTPPLAGGGRLAVSLQSPTDAFACVEVTFC